MHNIDIEYENINQQSTGSHDFLEGSRVVEIPFDRYIIKVRLSQSNEFLSIIGVIVNKEFLSQSQKLSKLSSSGYHDLEDYYQEEKE
jgi:hypothetical protein